MYSEAGPGPDLAFAAGYLVHGASYITVAVMTNRTPVRCYRPWLDDTQRLFMSFTMRRAISSGSSSFESSYRSSVVHAAVRASGSRVVSAPTAQKISANSARNFEFRSQADQMTCVTTSRFENRPAPLLDPVRGS
jgi:hypothetical protein